MKIRSATKKDIRELSKFNMSEPYYEFQPGNKAKKPIPLDRPRFKYIVLVAREEKRILGFVIAYFVQYSVSRYGHIEELYVGENFRNRRIGSSLVEAVLKKFKNLDVEAVFVSAHKNNEKAIKLYKGAGFEFCEGPWLYWDPKGGGKSRK